MTDEVKPRVLHKLPTEDETLNRLQDQYLSVLNPLMRSVATIQTDAANGYGVDDSTFNVKNFGAKGDGLTDDYLAIQIAIDKAAINGGVVYFPPGVYMVSASLLLRDNVRLIGAGAGNYNRGNGVKRITSIKAGVVFTGTSVIKIDAANNSPTAPYILGVSASSLTIDGFNVRATHTMGLEIRSLTNAETFSDLRFINFDVGSYIFIGMNGTIGATLNPANFNQSDGLVFNNIYTLSNNLTALGSPPDPAVVIEDANEVAFRDSKIQRSVLTPGSVGAHVRSTARNTVNAVTFDGCHFTGTTDCVLVEAVLNTWQGPRWVRVLNCGFETVKNGMRIVGSTTTNAQFNTFGPGNRMQTTTPGGSVLYLDAYATNNTAILDEYPGYGGDATNRIVTLAANSSGNTVIVNPDVAYVTDNGTDNLVMGRYGGTLRAKVVPASAAIAEDQGILFPDAELGSVLSYSGNGAYSVYGIQNGVVGQTVTLIITASGNYMDLTFQNGTPYVMGAWGRLFDGKTRCITFMFDGTSWIEISRSSDVPN